MKDTFSRIELITGDKMESKKHSKIYSLAMVVIGLMALQMGFQGCGGLKGASAIGQDGSASVSTPPPAVLPTVALAQPTSQVSNLGTTLQIPVNVTTSANYSGTLMLKVDGTALEEIDTGAAITFSFSPATVTVTNGTATTSMLTVKVGTNAPSFAMSLFTIEATDTMNSQITSSVAVPLQVKAIWNVYMDGPVTKGTAAPESFTLDGGATLEPGSVSTFISHSEGLVVNFYNMDSETHLVHSSGGPIPHESTSADYPGTKIIGLPPEVGTVASVYTNTVAPGTKTEVSEVYCHIHESGKYLRTLEFNSPVVPVTTTAPTTNPDATFTYLNANVFTKSCASCHSGATPAGGLDFSTYAGVLTGVTKGNATISAVYVAVSGTSPIMPQDSMTDTTVSNPLSAALVQDISDWINAGAPNN
jgi:hypothetical protein